MLLAMGFVHPVHEGMIKALGLELDPRGNVKADTLAYRSSHPKVFAAGDMRRGQSLVVWAIREGRQGAHAVDKFLMGSSDAAAVGGARSRRFCAARRSLPACGRQWASPTSRKDRKHDVLSVLFAWRTRARPFGRSRLLDADQRREFLAHFVHDIGRSASDGIQRAALSTTGSAPDRPAPRRSQRQRRGSETSNRKPFA